MREKSSIAKYGSLFSYRTSSDKIYRSKETLRQANLKLFELIEEREQFLKDEIIRKNGNPRDLEDLSIVRVRGDMDFMEVELGDNITVYSELHHGKHKPHYSIRIQNSSQEKVREIAEKLGL